MPASPCRFTILIANHNYGELVGRAVDSALQQAYPAELRQVVVVDDGSSDDSWQRLQAYACTPGVVLVQQPNRGQTAALAQGLQHASGDFICLLDADDTCLPDKLAALAEHIATLGATPHNLFLCHDLLIRDGPDGEVIDGSYFNHVRVKHYGPSLNLSVARHGFPFSVTSGMVFGRALLQRLMDLIPHWEWRYGSDSVLGHAAMVLLGEVQYLQRPLAHYVVHKDNNLASIIDGEFVAKPVWQDRAPKNLRLLEMLIDVLPLSEMERGERLGYVARLEHVGRNTRINEQHVPPRLSWAVDTTVAPAPRRSAYIAATRLAIDRQSDAPFEVLWLCHEGDEASVPGEGPHRALAVPPGAGLYARLRQAFLAARGGYFALLEAGDLPDKRFVARHLHVHRYGNLPMLTVSDMRLLDSAGTVIHAGIMHTAAQWGAVTHQVPALAAHLRDWELAPLAAVVLRRSPFLDAFFQAEALPVHDRHVGWLLCQYLLQLGGASRLAENLLDLRLPAQATPNAAWLSQFIDRHGPIQPVPDLALCVEEMLAAYVRAWDAQRLFFGEAWERRFVQWLAACGGPSAPERLVRRAHAIRGEGLAEYVAALLKPLQPLRGG